MSKIVVEVPDNDCLGCACYDYDYSKCSQFKFDLFKTNFSPCPECLMAREEYKNIKISIENHIKILENLLPNGTITKV